MSYRNLNVISEACQNNHTDDKKVIDKLLRIFENIFEHICPRVVEKTCTHKYTFVKTFTVVSQCSL